jgi:hypothetical protein
MTWSFVVGLVVGYWIGMAAALAAAISIDKAMERRGL